MKAYSKSICYILIITVLFSLIGIGSFDGQITHAAETDKSKVITVYTEPEDIYLGENMISETGTGLDTLVSPAYASGYDITWESSDTDIAEVDKNGHIHGRLTGKYSDVDKASCIITATVRLGELVAQDHVQVLVKRGYDLSHISLSPSVLAIQIKYCLSSGYFLVLSTNLTISLSSFIFKTSIRFIYINIIYHYINI